MIDDLEAFIAEHRSKVSQDKQERRTEPRSSAYQEPGRRNWIIPPDDQFTFPQTSQGGHKESRHFKPSTPENGIVNKLGEYAGKRQKLKEERRDEYNRFLAGQNFLRGVNPQPNGLSDGPSQQNDGFGASISGLQNHPTAELKKMAERNREYNEMLRNKRNLRNSPLSNRKGFESPVLSYEEILRKKRNEEKSYRRHNDPEYYDQRPKISDSHHRLSTSEDNLSRRPSQDDPRFTQQGEPKKVVKFGSSPHLLTGPAAFPDSARSRHLGPNTEHYNATLLIGERLNNDPRKKEAYRKELLNQMAETKALREREKLESKRGQGDIFSKRTDNDRRPTSWPTEEAATSGHPTGARTSTGPTTGTATRANQLPAIPQSYLGQRKPQFDENLPRSAYKIDGILANGFEFDLLQPRYQPPSSAPMQTGPSLMPYNNQIDDAYFYYANQNPLDPNLGSGPSSAVPLLVPSQPLPNLSAVQQPHHELESRRMYTRPNVSTERAPTGMIGFNSDDDARRNTEEKKKLYQVELQKQMAEDKLRKVNDRLAKEKYDKRLEEEIANYNPFGRGGGGAPVKDSSGNIVTSRNLGSLVHHEPRQVGFESQRTARTDPNPSTADLYQSPFKEAEKPGDNFARGGNGIFGEPISQELKNSRLKYQDDLRLQMEEQKLRREKEKEKMKREDELLEQRIREDELKAAKELEEVARKEKEKQEQLKKDQVAVRLKAEERKRLEEQQKREEEEAERERLRREEENHRHQKEVQRPRSPPIHSALTSLRKKHHDPVASPPIPAKRTQSRQSQVSHSYALEDLANLRRNQQMELRDFENDSKRIQSQPEVFDPRIVLRPQNMKHIDVFELAKSGRPASVRRGLPVKDPINRLKSNHRNVSSDGSADPFSDSDADALERSQTALLKAQMKDYEKLNKENSNRLRKDSEHSISDRPPSNLLKSTTDYLAFPIYELDNDAQLLPSHRRDPDRESDFSNVLERNQPLRRMNSVTSLDPAELTRKNEDRLRKLKSLAGDDLSTDDPDDVVEKFMMRQTGRRPPSGDTLNDNSWMMPSARR